ncbi:hypothetical protein K491DRAFT_125911 [Lophiostoma macrostomum CBS 122681]|uniref:Uncharacterized protein n=1 Tax=Lophiostoma macrostomum CBS 122681 TaxID=1314788 RepID=A0A6A6SS55_9PLEO|nr:hypothetical protein K491DRAFT_125911 [Lophiostoma macrostomum CBS 122681]
MPPIIQKRDDTLGGVIWIPIVIAIIVFVVGLSFGCYKATPRRNAKRIEFRTSAPASQFAAEKKTINKKPGVCCAHCPYRLEKLPKQSENGGISPNPSAAPFPPPGDPPRPRAAHVRDRQPSFRPQGYQHSFVGPRLSGAFPHTRHGPRAYFRAVPQHHSDSGE